MAGFDPRALLDVPPFPSDRYARLADRLAAIVGTKSDVLLVQGEAIVALEASATSLARPGLKALNIVTSPYGTMYGSWLRRGGADVTDLYAQPGMPIEAAAAENAFGIGDFDLVALVHAESATGILNPLPEIATLARARGALLVVDAVASAGGHALDVDRLGIDICAIGPQKSLGGPAGISALTVSPAAWRALERTGAPTGSVLSLLDHKRLWLDSGRGALPGMPSALEWHALSAALDRFEAEGIDAAVARHAVAGKATRAAVRALGLPLWIADDAKASNLVTVVRDAEAVVSRPAIAEAGIDPAVGVAGLIRLNHTGERARRPAVEAMIDALCSALGSKPDAARAAIAAAYEGG